MSRRQLKKMFGTGPRIEKVDDSSDSDSPISHKEKINPFKGLDVSTGSGSEAEPDEPGENEAHEEEASPTFNRKKTKKKNKKSSETSEDIDDIVDEVNKILGQTQGSTEKQPVMEHQFETIFAVYKKYINAKLELDRRLGPEEGQRIKKKQKKEYISDDIAQVEGVVRCNGLSMSKCHTENGIKYYTYDHSPDYQKKHKQFLNENIVSVRRNMFHNIDLEYYDTVEAEIERVALLFLQGQYLVANLTLDYLVARLQYAADPTFGVCNRTCRLEYKVVENRPFHIAVLQYCHVLCIKGCYRTALELAKVLLNLDRSDPMAVIIIIDIIAIMANEYEWLLRAITWFEKERNGDFLHNLPFSKALAVYHIAVKNKKSLNVADKLIKKALLFCPFMFDSLAKAGGSKPTGRIKELLEHPFYNIENVETWSLHQMTKLYAAFLDSWWKDRPVYEWLVRNAEELLHLLETSDQHRKHAEEMKAVRVETYKVWPVEVYRHMSVIKPLSQDILNGAVPPVYGFKSMYRFNPVKEKNSVNRYQYKETP